MGLIQIVPLKESKCEVENILICVVTEFNGWVANSLPIPFLFQSTLIDFTLSYIININNDLLRHTAHHLILPERV